MTLEIKINCDNSAFEGENLSYEIKQCLYQVLKGINNRNPSIRIRDTNGNPVGYFKFIKD